MATITETATAPEAEVVLRASGPASTEPPASGIDLIEKIHVIPTFTDKYAERQWAKEHMAAAFRIFAKMGFNDGAGGHISLRDPVQPDCFWINPYAVHFALIKASDLILVNEEGQPLTPTPYKVNKAGFMIHAALHKARPDVHAAAHTHSPYGRAWSTFGKPIEMLNQDMCFFYNDLSVYEGFGGVVLAREEGDRIAQALGPTNKSVILQNHGILTCGGTVDEAAALFIALEQACQTQLLAEAAAANGLEKKYVGNAEAAYTKKGSGTPEVLFMQFKPEYDLILKETKGDFLD
ncbi:class II aldolase and Adducin domain-containing protein [Thozetella sp. PMI_491]|nr:class II aldolase and Adducin domain-containing protein [Thozetella sp. PMI_491]